MKTNYLREADFHTLVRRMLSDPSANFKKEMGNINMETENMKKKVKNKEYNNINE